jgi:2-polyprenyl-3-methyl-5-hydroxy-6-metoxy-1,4-benzoquinol methylase
MDYSNAVLAKKYDEYYTADPEKWSGEERD